MDRDEALALLRKNHEFPGLFEFRAVVRPHATAAVLGAISAAAGGGAAQVHERRSSKGSYVALHVHIHVEAPERVLDVWEVLKGVDGVMATL